MDTICGYLECELRHGGNPEQEHDILEQDEERGLEHNYEEGHPEPSRECVEWLQRQKQD